MEKERKRRKVGTIEALSKWADVFRGYAVFLNLYYEDRGRLSEKHVLELEKIRLRMEKFYNDFIEWFEIKTKTSYPIPIAHRALGLNAWNEPWFIEGVKQQISSGRKRLNELDLPDPFDIGQFIEQIHDMEDRVSKGEEIWASFEEGHYHTRNSYFRDVPPKAVTLILHFCYGFLNPSLHSQTLQEWRDSEGIPAIEAQKDLDEIMERLSTMTPPELSAFYSF